MIKITIIIEIDDSFCKTATPKMGLEEPLVKLNMPDRYKHALYTHSPFRTVGDLVKLTDEDILMVPYCGQTTLKVVKNALAAVGLSLKQ